MASNVGAWFGWRGSADTDLRFSEFFSSNHTIMARVMLQYPLAFAGPFFAQNGLGNYFVGQGDYRGSPEGAKLLISIGNQSQNYTSGLLQAGEWLHVAVVRSGNTFKLYLNGTHVTPDLVVSANEGNMPDGNSTLRMGRRSDGATGNETQYYGFIDDVAVFNTALSEQQIDNIIGEADSRLHGSESNLLAAWIFDQSLPSGAALPAKFQRPLVFNSDPKDKRAGTAILSSNRDSAFDAKLLPLPYQEVEWTLPFTTGQAWSVSQGNCQPTSHNGTSAFSWDLVLQGDPTPDKPTNPNGASCGEPLYSVAAGTVIDLSDIGGGVGLSGCGPTEPAIDGKNFVCLELARDEIASYLHTLTGSIKEALGSTTPPMEIGKGVLIAKVGTRCGHNCHLHLASASGRTGAILSQTINGVTFPVAISNYEACDAQDGKDCTKEQNWYKVTRGIPQQMQWVRRRRQWSGWQDLSGILSSGPAVASRGQRRMDVFARGLDNALWIKWWDGDSWHGWQSLGGSFKDAPCAVSWGSNRIDVFVRGMNDHLGHKFYDGNSWHDWTDLGGVLASGPAVASRGLGRMDVFARGLDNALWIKWWDGDSWHGWQSLGGSFRDAPCAVSWGSNRIDVFVRGMNDHLGHKFYDGNSWHDWTDLGGVLASGPAVASRGLGRMDVFARGLDNALWIKWWDGDSWHGWQSLGGSFKDAPCAVSWGSNRIDVFVRGMNDHLERLWLS